MSKAVGIFKDLPAAAYHSNRDFIGSSTLVKMESSPAEFFLAWKGPQEEPTTPMINGSFLHSLCLEENLEDYVPRPMLESGRAVSRTSRAFRQFQKEHPGKTPVHPNMFAASDEISSVFRSNKDVMKLLIGADIETSMFAIDPTSGQPIKARTDIRRPKAFPRSIWDLKSTDDTLWFWKKRRDFRYDVRLIHYGMVDEIITGEEVLDYGYIALGFKPQLTIEIIQLSKDEIARAKSTWRWLMGEIANCQRSGSWAARDTGSSLRRSRPLVNRATNQRLG